LQPKPADLGENIGWRRRTVVLDGGLNYGQQLPLQRAMMPFGSLSQALHHPIRRVLDGQVQGHGSESAPGWMFS